MAEIPINLGWISAILTTETSVVSRKRPKWELHFQQQACQFGEFLMLSLLGIYCT